MYPLFQAELQEKNDRHGRNSLLATYINYQAHLPHPDFRGAGQQQQNRRPSSAMDEEVGSIMNKGGAPAGAGGAGFRNGEIHIQGVPIRPATSC